MSPFLIVVNYPMVVKSGEPTGHTKHNGVTRFVKGTQNSLEKTPLLSKVSLSLSFQPKAYFIVVFARFRVRKHSVVDCCSGRCSCCRANVYAKHITIMHYLEVRFSLDLTRLVIRAYVKLAGATVDEVIGDSPRTCGVCAYT